MCWFKKKEEEEEEKEKEEGEEEKVVVKTRETIFACQSNLHQCPQALNQSPFI